MRIQCVASPFRGLGGERLQNLQIVNQNSSIVNH
jgi:hypothetical protein